MINKKDLFEKTLQEGASLDTLLEEIFKDEELTEAESKQLHNATVDEVLKKLAEKDPIVKLILYRRYLQVFEDILQDLFEKEKNKIENKKWFQNWQELKQGNLKDFQSGWQKFKKGLFKSLNVVGKGFAAIGNAIGAIYTAIVCS